MKKIMFLFLLGFLLVLSGCGKNEKEIKVYTRDTSSGTRDGFFTTISFKDATSDNTPLVKGYIEVGGNGDMIRALKNDEFGIGYISLVSLGESGLKGLAVDGVSPTEENVLNGSYKLTRNFNYNIRSEFASDVERDIVNAFVAYLSTKEAKATIKGEGGIVAINATDPSWDDIKDNYPVTKQDNSSVTIRFGGSTSVESIAKKLSSEFSTKCGNFKFEHDHTGSSDAYKRTQGSEKDSTSFLHIGFASREYKVNDNEKLASGTYGFICVDAIVAVVNDKNDVSAITTAQLKSIYDGTITKWEDLQ